MPTYLTCQLDRAPNQLEVEIVADEANRTAVVSLPKTGRIVTRTAIFSPETVRILDDPSVWTVDRVSLQLTRDLTIGSGISTRVGHCKLTPVPTERAF